MMKIASTRTAAVAVSRFASPSTLKINPQLACKLGSQQRNKATVALQSSGGSQARSLALVGLAFGGVLGQLTLGHGENFFEHRFTTDADAQDLADFYGTEDFMEVFCVFPFMVNFMMRQAEFDDEGNIHAWGISGPGQLKVSIEFDEEEEDDAITYFNKRETFRDVLPSWLGGGTIWEMTQNFGYRMKADGKCEVYHQGEHFDGFFPMRLVFAAHSYYVIWATQRYVNSPEFGAEDGDRAEEFRQNIPMHEFQLFIDGLSRQVESAKKDADVEKQKELEVTLQRLQTVSGMDQAKLKPRLMTLRSHKTHVESVHLMVDDKETKETIQMAMEQIGSANKTPQQPLNAMRNLSRRTTLANLENKEEPKTEGRRRFLGIF